MSMNLEELRDQFAAAALTGFMAVHPVVTSYDPEIVERAYHVADLMLKERARRSANPLQEVRDRMMMGPAQRPESVEGQP